MGSPRLFLAVTENSARGESLGAMLAKVGDARVDRCSPSAVRADGRRRGLAAVFLDAEEGDGSFDLCRDLRRSLPAAACALILFGRGAREDLIRGLDAGADDYWRVPFNESVCLAYLRAILRRLTKLETAEAAVAEVSGLRLDVRRRRAFLGDLLVPLRAKEFDLLRFLIQRRGDALSREVLLSEVWGYRDPVATRTVDYHVSQLRQKLEPWGRRIETVAGVGYRLAE